jgi:hypothetical protein
MDVSEEERQRSLNVTALLRLKREVKAQGSEHTKPAATFAFYMSLRSRTTAFCAVASIAGTTSS